MKLNVFGLVSIDTINFQDGISYIGGGALATAWLASLWKVPTVLYSLTCNQECQQRIQDNILFNNNCFGHTTFSTNKEMVRFYISESEQDYSYAIRNFDTAKEELKLFLEMTSKEQYIKLPASHLVDCASLITDASYNPQGRYDLFELTKKITTSGFVFLNRNELLNGMKLDFQCALKAIERTKQSYVITLGINGAICYYAVESKWYCCPIIKSEKLSNTLGCGDAFAGGFLAAYTKYSSITQGMIIGTVSAYLATYSPSNMITVWLPTISESDIITKLLYSVKVFETSDGVIQYMKSDKFKSVKWDLESYFSEDFDWKID